MSSITTPHSLREILEGTYRGRRVLITGHNGFVGSWLSCVLANAGALVTGLSLTEEPGGLAEAIGLSSLVQSIDGDIQNYEVVRDVVDNINPEIVFHLAAQALVLPSYEDPLTTWSTNVLGTAHVLEALRHASSPKACVVITSDKCYATADKAHVETDPLGGDDPYSASKSGAEMVAHSYRESFFADHRMGLATARAGNIVGGGDRSAHRIVPDCIRAIEAGESVLLRHPEAVRPWQHVLDAVAGYIRLGAGVVDDPATYSTAWNFGPPHEAAATVGAFVQGLIDSWRRHSAIAPHDPTVSDQESVPERTILTLDSSKSHQQLNWHQLIEFNQTIDLTVGWYADMVASNNADGARITAAQIDRFVELDAAFTKPKMAAHG